MSYFNKVDSNVYIVSWENKEVLGSYPVDELGKAKRACKKIGHTGEFDIGSTGYPPVASVQNHLGECIYNPRFKYEVV